MSTTQQTNHEKSSNEQTDSCNIVVAAMYKFVTLDDYTSLREPLFTLLESQEIRGTLLLAQEGINGTVAGTRLAIDTLKSWLEKDGRFDGISYKESYAEINPFARTKVKLKKEIVTMGVEDIDPKQIVGTYVKPEEWNALISDPDVLLVDTRNDYEVEIGTFKNAINPHTESFREFPQYVKDHLDQTKHKKVAMFCTGGIRCEKSTAFLKQQGFEEVYHLEGGILKYLEEVPQEETMWEGDCFVFDDRVAVNHQLEKSVYGQCNACRLPITEEDKESEHFIEGVSCPRCYNKHTKAQKARFAERQKQVELARKRNENHIGGDVSKTIQARKQAKRDAIRRQQAQEKQQSKS